MTKLTRTLSAVVLAGTLANLAACGDDDSGDSGSTTGGGNDAGATVCPEHPNVTEEGNVCKITAPTGNEIVEDLTLAPVEGKEGYLLDGAVYVGEDVGGAMSPAAGKKAATLSIEAGTKIIGANVDSFLVINRGSKIMAEGTADAPITFTGPGEPGKQVPGEWGGVLLAGRATTNQGTAVDSEIANLRYGGPDDRDDSGVLKYVRVEFGGSKNSPESEHNGITFLAVGNRTVVDYVQVHANNDDGIEFFGGTVNVKHVVITGCGDDNIDWTDGWRGKVQFAVIQQWPNFGDAGIEADNRENNETATPISSPTLSNITLIGASKGDGGYGIRLRRGTKAKIYNAVITGWKSGCLYVDGKTSGAFAGSGISFDSTAVSCGTNFVDWDEEDDMEMVIATHGYAKDAFDMGAGNMELASGDVFTKAATGMAFDPTPTAASGLLSGGEAPGDSFFESAAFVGGVGRDNWLAGWVAMPSYMPPAE